MLKIGYDQKSNVLFSETQCTIISITADAAVKSGFVVLCENFALVSAKKTRNAQFCESCANRTADVRCAACVCHIDNCGLWAILRSINPLNNNNNNNNCCTHIIAD